MLKSKHLTSCLALSILSCGQNTQDYGAQCSIRFSLSQNLSSESQTDANLKMSNLTYIPFEIPESCQSLVGENIQRINARLNIRSRPSSGEIVGLSLGNQEGNLLYSDRPISIKSSELILDNIIPGSMMGPIEKLEEMRILFRFSGEVSSGYYPLDVVMDLSVKGN